VLARQRVEASSAAGRVRMPALERTTNIDPCYSDESGSAIVTIVAGAGGDG
jgi:hypothetical protein